MSRIVALFLVVTCALLWAVAASAQGLPSPAPSPQHVENAFDQILNQGILGSLVIIEAVVIALMVREIKGAQKEVLTWAIQSTQAAQKTEAALTKATEQLVRNEATLTQVLSVLSAPRGH